MTLSLTGARWTPIFIDPDRLAALISGKGMSEVAARCLAARWGPGALPSDGAGLPTPSMEQLHDPMRMKGMASAIERLRSALRDKHHVRIITDYDVDGTTSSLILQATLRTLDPDVRLTYHIPSRFGEGYGFSVKAAETAIADDVDLIVTADIGVRDHAAVDFAADAGVDVLICDHHLPAGASVPERATVLCPPQAGCTYPNRALAACGVSLKLADALLSAHPHRERILGSLLKLAAVGTVADLVPLNTLENRAIVSLGLDALNRGPHHAGLQALLEVAGLTCGAITEEDLGFRVGPRINAAGRLADARLVVRLLTCRDTLVAKELAREIDGMNRNRQEIQGRLADQALQAIGETPPSFVVVAGPEVEGWHRGVVGIVASAVKDKVHRPTAVVSVQGDFAVGSVRSVPTIHAVRALDSVSDLLVKYGGHPAAAGFTVPSADLGALRERLCRYVDEQKGAEPFVAERVYDAEVPATRLNGDTMRELAALGPFGQGNARPSLMVRDVVPHGMQVRNGGHLKFLVPKGSGTIAAMWWRHADLAGALEGKRVDLLGHLKENVWQGQRSVEFEVEDARLPETAG